MKYQYKYHIENYNRDDSHLGEFLTKNPDVALIEIKEKIYDRLAEVRRIKAAFVGRDEPYWDGVMGQCTNEEYFLSNLLDIIERS